MDLYTYTQIDVLDKVAKANNIECPRLRGYRLMKDEEFANTKVSKEDYEEAAYNIVERLCESDPFWYSKACCFSLCYETDLKKAYYLDEKNEKVRWDRIHGWKRRVLKTAIHNKFTREHKQYSIFNKYVGRDDILYIHARIGGGNWSYYFDQVVNQPWFVEKVDDSFDSTYCDIYAKIDPATATEEAIKKYVEEAQKEQSEQVEEELESDSVDKPALNNVFLKAIINGALKDAHNETENEDNA